MLLPANPADPAAMVGAAMGVLKGMSSVTGAGAPGCLTPATPRDIVIALRSPPPPVSFFPLPLVSTIASVVGRVWCRLFAVFLECTCIARIRCRAQEPSSPWEDCGAVFVVFGVTEAGL